jgi:hypothetical protein
LTKSIQKGQKSDFTVLEKLCVGWLPYGTHVEMETSAFLVRDFGEMDMMTMNDETIYTEAPPDVALDFLDPDPCEDPDLPPPSELVRKEPPSYVFSVADLGAFPERANQIA